MPGPGQFAARRGDEIVIAGQFFHTGTPVVLWMDPGGYDAYRVERRFSPLEKANWESSKAENKDLGSPNRFNLRAAGLSKEEIEKVRGGGWDLPLLQRVVDQFVIHFDACGTSRQCFKVLHDHRGLSVHFMLDLDGTIYQTLDLKERAWHAGKANARSVGIELANIGAYPPGEDKPLSEWYVQVPNDQTRVSIPERFGDGGIHTHGFVAYPARPKPVSGQIQSHSLTQYDYTPEQYQALIHLTATLVKVLPRIKCVYPTDPAGKLVSQTLPEEQLDTYQGLLGHFHIQPAKVDPGPAFQWDYVVQEARRLLNGGMSEAAHRTSRGHMPRP